MKKEESIIKQYLEFELLEGREPHSVFEFCKKYNHKETTFYKYFNSLKQIRKSFLERKISEVLKTLDEDPNYDDFSANEKALALFFTLFESFLEHRSYLIARYGKVKNPQALTGDWELFFERFDSRMESILAEAKNNEEIQDRPLVGNYYSKSFKLVFLYVFRVWINDESDDFQTTDAAIEKSVNLAFEFFGHSPLDSLLDFGKFALKTKVV
ncbi:MAG: hypothetical protein R3277_09380 [Brumimicrobium sp.]|nr:hypothetical protein [Brumimicrobium sp.]